MKSRLLLAALAVTAIVVTASLRAADTEKKDPLAGVKCIVSGKKVVAASATAHKGGKIYFCCTNCPKAFAKDKAKYAVKANTQLAATGQAKQAKCPLTGRPLNKAQTVSVSGVKVTFCCPNCKGKVAKAKGAAQAALVFADKAFDKGFKIAAKEKK